MKMSFGTALYALKQGKKVARKGWNGKGQFVYLVTEDSYPVKMDAAKELADENGKVKYGAYMALKTVDGTVVPWTPSQTDCLAEDWELTNDSHITDDDIAKQKKELDEALDEAKKELTKSIIGFMLEVMKPDEEDCEECKFKDICATYEKKETNKDAKK